MSRLSCPVHPSSRRPASRALAVCAAVAAFACGGSTDATLSSPLADAPAEHAEGEGTSPGSPAGQPGAEQGRPGAKEGQPGQPGARADLRIDPIEVGRAWTYNVEVLGVYPICSNGVFTATATESSQLDGKTAIHVQSLCENAGVYKYAVEGDRVHAHFGGRWRTSFDAPVIEGHTWTDGYRDYKWERRGSITTPAGTFAECWSATTIASFTSYIIACRGVGPVKWHYEDGLGNGYEAVLVAKNF